MEWKKRRYVHIDCETGSKEIFAIFEEIESKAESDVENLLEDSDTIYRRRRNSRHK